MSFNHFQLYANPWDNTADVIERRLRLARTNGANEPEPEFPEAELDDAQRRAAIARERMRRQRAR